MFNWIRNYFKSPFESPNKLWGKIEIEYPIMHYDFSIPDLVIKHSKEEVLGDVDFWAWKWDDNERIIDSNGKVIKTKFERIQNKTSGAYPNEIEKVYTLEEFKGVVIDMLKMIDNEEWVDELIIQVNSCVTIKEIIKRLSDKF